MAHLAAPGPVPIAPARAHASALFLLLLAASCSSTGEVAPPSVIGEWQETSDGDTQIMFFNRDGTCGTGDRLADGRAICQPCTYRYEGGSVYVQQAGSVRNMPVSITYDTMTVTGLDIGAGSYTVFSRENASPTNRCP